MKKHSRFWDWYASCYDTLLKAIPYQRLLDQVANCVPPGTAHLLDAGCGTGNLLRVLRERRPAASLHGFDSSSSMLGRAKAKISDAELRLGDLNGTLPYQDESFDVVTCINVLYAVGDPAQIVAEVKRILRPGGLLIASSPLPNPRIRPIIRAHATQAGWLKTIPLLAPMLVLVLFNLFIVGRRRSYHFMEERAVERLLGCGAFERTYAGQNWFLCVRKGEN